MDKVSKDGLNLIALGAVAFVLVGIIAARAFPAPFADFRGLYFPSRCLIAGHDPYDPTEVRKFYLADGGSDLAVEHEAERRVAVQLPYPPTAFIASLPFALFARTTAQLLWLFVTAAGLILASFLTWRVSRSASSLLAAALTGYLLANCPLLILLGNPAGLAISLSVMAVWSFINERFERAAVLGLALALSLKPQDAGIIWLFLLLAGLRFRTRAIQSLVVLVCINLPIALWVRTSRRIGGMRCSQITRRIQSAAGSTIPAPPAARMVWP